MKIKKRILKIKNHLNQRLKRNQKKKDKDIERSLSNNSKSEAEPNSGNDEVK